MNDFLMRETARLMRLQSKSASALDLVTRTISKLRENNRAIEESKDRIAEYQDCLTAATQELTELQTKNTRIIENFSRLSEG